MIAYSLCIYFIVPTFHINSMGLPIDKKFYKDFDWVAKDYFQDPKVIALAEAIIEQDLPECQRLIEAGARANSQGKGKMDLLLWSFGVNNRKIVELLLKNGADPCRYYEDGFTTDRNRKPTSFQFYFNAKGRTFFHAAVRNDTTYLDLLFKYGGDPYVESKVKHYDSLYPMPIYDLICMPCSEFARIKNINIMSRSAS